MFSYNIFIGWILILKGRIFILWKLQSKMLGEIFSSFFLKMLGQGRGGEDGGSVGKKNLMTKKTSTRSV
jgi:hypothetical protein